MKGFVLNDRLFNVEEIAQASIGPRSVIDDTQTVRYHMYCVLLVYV